MKLVVCSDLHLDAVTAGVRRFDDVASSFRRVQHRAREIGATLVVLGDVYDPDAGSIVHRGAHLLIEAAVGAYRSIWLPGNHDVIEDGTGQTTLEPLKVLRDVFSLPAVDIYDRPTYEYLDEEVDLLALPFTARAADYDPADFVRRLTMPPAKKSNRTLLVLSHLHVAGVVPGSETEDMPRGRPMHLPAAELREMGNQYKRVVVLQGHYHRGETVVIDGLKIHIVGSLERLRFDEERHSPGWLELEI